MNKTPIALALALFATGSAFAQSSVSIYGLVDAGVNYINGQNAAKTRLSSGVMEGSRWGLKGNEDLGGGYRTVFTLEGRFESDTGSNSNRAASGSQVPDRFTDLQFLGLPNLGGVPMQAIVNGVGASLGSQIGVNLNGALFDRQAFVGLVTPVGAVLAGRQYTPAYEMFYLFDAMQTESSLSAAQVATLPAAVDIRKNNAIAYRIQKDGITATLHYAFGETPGATSNGSYVSANAYYKADSYAFGAAYGANKNAQGEKSLSNVTVGAYLDVGPGRLSALTTAIKDDHPGVGVTVAGGLQLQGIPTVLAGLVGKAYERALRQDAQLYHVGYRIGLGQNTVTVAYTRLDDKTVADADVQSFGAVYTYAFSKRTDVNFVATKFINDPRAQAAPGGNGFFGGVTSTAGRDAENLAIALRHRF